MENTNPKGDQPSEGQLPNLKLEKVEAAMQSLLFLGLIAVLGLIVFAIFGASDGNRMRFLLWSLVVAAACVGGGVALGLLFGLPTVRRIQIVGTATTDGQPTGGDRGDRLGYSESTSLEQVADWLTKIIIGLTLTQYGSWEQKFAGLSCNVTHQLLVAPGGKGFSCSAKTLAEGVTIPGGFLVALFSILGFLTSYLWMRAHFISEMEAAKSIAIAKAQVDQIASLTARIGEKNAELAAAESNLAAATALADQFQQELRTKQEQGLGQSRQTPAPEIAREMAAQAVSQVRKNVVATVKELMRRADSPQYPNDPWLTLFGGQASVDGLTLRATVQPTENNPDWFNVQLEVERAAGREAPVESVLYFLHPTFGKEPRSVSFGSDSKAPLDLIAYGAFTVGVLADDGTMLELDLAKLEGVDRHFLAR